MRCYISVACALSVFVSVCLAAPATLDQSELSELAPINDQALSVPNGVLGTSDNTEVTRNKRTIGILRQLFPQLSKVVDNVIQNLTGQVFRIFGSAILRSGGLGGGGNRGGSSNDRKVSVVLPTFPPDEEDEDDDDEDDDSETSNSLPLGVRFGDSTENITLSNALSIDSSTDTSATSGSSISTGTTSVSSTSESSTSESSTSESSTSDSSTSSMTLYTSATSDSENRIVRQIRIARDVDQEAAASGGNGPSLISEDLSNVDTESDADRNKRFLPFLGGGGGDGHSSGGGSGNFLFDIIRQSADQAARAAGTVYRMVAGTENLGFGITATSTSSKTVATAAGPQLIAGSGATEESDEKENGAEGPGGIVEVDVAKSDEPIPGPITRLLVVANRGIANLVQDLILRLAATSERIVNFKARLITSLI